MSEPAGRPMVRGELFATRLAYLRENHGSAAIGHVLEQLSEAEREALKTLEGDAWYPFESLARLDRAIHELLEPADLDVFERLGEASARLRTLWLGEHAPLVTVHAFLSRLAEDHRRFHTFGRAEYRRTGFTEGEISYSEYPAPEETYCLSGRGYLKYAIGLLTGAAASVDEIRCQCRGDAACTFRVQWMGSGRYTTALAEPGSA